MYQMGDSTMQNQHEVLNEITHLCKINKILSNQ